MEKTTTAQRLKEIMSTRNLRQVDILELAQPYCEKHKIKLSKSALSQFLSGKYEPGQWKLTILGKALNVSEAWLMGYDVPMEREEAKTQQRKYPSNILPLPKTYKLPLYGNIACGIPIHAEQNIEDYIDTPEDVHADFCLRCNGDSMINARILDGDIVFIREQTIVDDGEIAAVLIDDEATLKRVYYDQKKNKLVLNAENPAFAPLVYVGEELETIHILGKAVYFTSLVK